AYPWLFTTKAEPAKGDKVINVPAEFMDGASGKVIATKQAMQLVAYLQSLKQVKLPDGSPVPDFLYKKSEQTRPGTASELDGAALYATNCQSCHQANGEGLKGAFPSLKGSKIVLDDNPELMVSIIMNGYNGRASEGLAAMPAVGANNNLSAEAIAAIMNHEKTSWGNNAKKVTAEQIKTLMEVAKLSAQN